jgi:hypothetical protein
MIARRFAHLRAAVTGAIGMIKIMNSHGHD